jgi:hypothetical protein
MLTTGSGINRKPARVPWPHVATHGSGGLVNHDSLAQVVALAGTLATKDQCSRTAFYHPFNLAESLSFATCHHRESLVSFTLASITQVGGPCTPRVSLLVMDFTPRRNERDDRDFQCSKLSLASSRDAEEMAPRVPGFPDHEAAAKWLLHHLVRPPAVRGSRDNNPHSPTTMSRSETGCHGTIMPKPDPKTATGSHPAAIIFFYSWACFRQRCLECFWHQGPLDFPNATAAVQLTLATTACDGSQHQDS